MPYNLLGVLQQLVGWRGRVLFKLSEQWVSTLNSAVILVLDLF